MSTVSRDAVALRVGKIGVGSPPVPDPLAGIPNDPFFDRKLRFTQVMDSKGRIRLGAFTIQE